MLRFHADAVALLPAAPAFSASNAALLAEQVTKLGIRWPASLCEWYSLEGAVDLLRQYSNDDLPTPLEELGVPFHDWYGVDHRDFLSQGLLVIMHENQGVSNWAVQLNGTEDPPVVVEVDSAPNEVWLPLAKSFSEFVYCQIWDHPKHTVACSAQEPDLAPHDLEFLRSTFQEGPTTSGWPGQANYRFAAPWGRILIWHQEVHGTDWILHAASADDLARLLRSVWHCGTLSESLWGSTAEEAQCLERMRQSLST